jgi:hypothetical protein
MDLGVGAELGVKEAAERVEVDPRRQGEEGLAQHRVIDILEPRARLWPTAQPVGYVMAKSNLTIQLDDAVIRRARVVAAKKGTSVSALVARELDELVAREDRYEEARRRAFELMSGPKRRGGRSWTRDDLYAERLDRLDR